MKKTFIIPAALLVFAIVLISYFILLINSTTPKQSLNNPCIPTFEDGDGPYYIKEVPFRENIAPKQNNGEKLIVTGRVLKSDCKTPLANVVLNVWQADETGNYQNEWYRGKVKSKIDGRYYFETVMPKGYGEGTAFRPPHIHFKVFINQQLIITSEMFFPDVKGKPGFNSGYIVSLEEKTISGKKTYFASHDIILPR